MKLLKKITMFTMESCPYCKEALRWMDELLAANADYMSLEIEKIDELIYPDIAGKYDYYYVPTYYVADDKLHEGVASLEKIRRVFDAAMGE
jgi:glutaredoxin